MMEMYVQCASSTVCWSVLDMPQVMYSFISLFYVTKRLKVAFLKCPLIANGIVKRKPLDKSLLFLPSSASTSSNTFCYEVFPSNIIGIP